MEAKRQNYTKWGGRKTWQIICSFKHWIFFQDVNCTDIKTVESPDNTVALETPLDSPNKTLASDKLEEEFEFDEKEFSNLTDSNGNLNISEISADEVSLSHRSLGHFKSKKKNEIRFSLSHPMNNY